jgi:hypothetical protein
MDCSRVWRFGGFWCLIDKLIFLGRDRRVDRASGEFVIESLTAAFTRGYFVDLFCRHILRRSLEPLVELRAVDILEVISPTQCILAWDVTPRN